MHMNSTSEDIVTDDKLLKLKLGLPIKSMST